MDNNEETCTTHNMTLTSNTKIGLTFGQILSLITIAGAFVMGYADLNSRIADIERRQSEIHKTWDKQAEINQQLTNTTFEIRQSLIRIEGKLDLKADKNWVK